jgi:Ca2+/Na+ antiporter
METVREAPEPAAAASAPLAVATTASSTVLGADITPEKAAGILGAIATSPTRDLEFILSALIVLVLVLFVIAVVVHARVQYKEVIGGGLLLLVVLFALLVYTRSSKAPVELPADTQAAAVYNALAP